MVLSELMTARRGALAPSTTIAPFYRHLLTCANGTTTTGTAGARTRSPRLIDYSHYLAPRFALARETRRDSSTQEKSRFANKCRLRHVIVLILSHRVKLVAASSREKDSRSGMRPNCNLFIPFFKNRFCITYFEERYDRI